MGSVLLQARSSADGVTIRLDGETVSHTAVTGAFVVFAAQPGRRTVTAWRQGYLTSRTVVDVRPHRVTDVGSTLLVAGDAWADGTIDILDVLNVSAAFDRCEGDSSFQSWLDFNADGCINAPDLSIVTSNFGYRAPTIWSAAPPIESFP